MTNISLALWRPNDFTFHSPGSLQMNFLTRRLKKRFARLTGFMEMAMGRWTRRNGTAL